MTRASPVTSFLWSSYTRPGSGPLQGHGGIRPDQGMGYGVWSRGRGKLGFWCVGGSMGGGCWFRGGRAGQGGASQTRN